MSYVFFRCTMSVNGFFLSMCLKENPLSKFENRIFKSICDVGGKAMSHDTAYAEQRGDCHARPNSCIES